MTFCSVVVLRQFAVAVLQCCGCGTLLLEAEVMQCCSPNANLTEGKYSLLRAPFPGFPEIIWCFVLKTCFAGGLGEMPFWGF